MYVTVYLFILFYCYSIFLMKNTQKKMGRPPVKNGEQSTKDKIFNTAIDLFAEKGYNSTPIRDISNALGLTEGAIYRHYSNKEELLNAIFKYAENLIFSPLPIEATLNSLDGISIFRGLLEPLPDIINSEPYMIKIMRIMFHEMNRNEQIGEIYVKQYNELGFELIYVLFEKCQKMGTLKTTDLKALTLLFNSFRFSWAYNTFIVKQNSNADLSKIKAELEMMIQFFETNFWNTIKS
ncbi:MAG: transcriptional regulator, TetR family [Bacteroidetes bacterium]|nr:transcriptional regulator, TetR family [Bacteroidota bacterium]